MEADRLVKLFMNYDYESFWFEELPNLIQDILFKEYNPSQFLNENHYSSPKKSPYVKITFLLPCGLP